MILFIPPATKNIGNFTHALNRLNERDEDIKCSLGTWKWENPYMREPIPAKHVMKSNNPTNFLY